MLELSQNLHHLAIIPDGNRRWAQVHKYSIWGGYQKGAAQFKNVMQSVFDRQVRYLTFWAASKDNLLKRSKQEVNYLIKLLKSYLKEMLNSNELIEKGVRVDFRGQGLALSQDKELQALAAKLEEKTKGFSKHVLTILFGYDGREEMLSAASTLEENSEQDLRSRLWTGDLPDVDLVIRTGAEPHNSAGFMMWHTANSELYFSKLLWPDFTEVELDRAFADFSQRRRKGGA